jgi:hypothetical protein
VTTATFRLVNISPDAQERVARATAPTRALDALKLPEGVSILPTGELVQRDRGAVGSVDRVWIRARLAGGEHRNLNLVGFSPVPPDKLASVMPPARLDWLLDKPEDAVLKLWINGAEVPLAFLGVVTAGPMVQVWRFGAKGGGFRTVVYATLANGQDVFDCEGYVVWNDKRTQSVTLNNARIEIRHGEDHAPLIAHLLGQYQDGLPSDGARQVVLDAASNPNNWLPDSMAVPFFFSLIAQPDVPVAPPTDATVPPGSAPTDQQAVDQIRNDNAQAAKGGPIMALAGSDLWNGSIGPLMATATAIPFTPAPSTLMLDEWRTLWDSRPWANPKSSGQTGDQGIFGRIKALHIFADGDPKELLALLYSATDYFVRSHHFLLANGDPLPPEGSSTDPLLTYGTAPFWRAAGAAWGKNNGNNDPPFGWDHGERAYLDPQHRGNLFMPIALALLGSPILQDELDFLLACDLRDTRLRNNTIDAARAAGRLMQEWAWWHWVASPTQQKWLEHLAEQVLTICESQPTYTVSGPQKWLAVFSKFNDKNPLRNTTDPTMGYDAASPWEHSFVCDGATAWAALYVPRADKTNETARFLKLAINLAESVVGGALIEDPALGPIVVTYCKVNPGGAANPPDYLTLPRPLAQQSDGSWTGFQVNLGANCDGVVTGIALQWYSGAILTCAAAGTASAEKAQRLKAKLLQISHSQRDVEWLVGGY